MRFANQYQGNPRQAVMQMLQNGQVGNDKLKQAMALANQFRGFLK